MVSELRKGYLATGSYVPHAKAVSPQGAMSLAVAGATTGNCPVRRILIITVHGDHESRNADDTWKRRRQRGDGHRRNRGSGAICCRGEFHSCRGANPSNQALSTAVMMQEFKLVDQKLDTIKSTLDRAIAQIEATHAGELLAASRIVDDVYRQYDLEGAFSNDMIVRLASETPLLSPSDSNSWWKVAEPRFPVTSAKCSKRTTTRTTRCSPRSLSSASPISESALTCRKTRSLSGHQWNS